MIKSGAHLGDERRVAHGRGQADSQSLEVAVDDVGLGYEAEGAQVAQADSCQDDVAQLPTGGFHHWGVPEPDTHTQKEWGKAQQLSADFIVVSAFIFPLRSLERSPHLMKTAVTKNVAIWPRQAKTTAAMGSGSPHRRYSTGIGSQPAAYERRIS